MASRRVVGTLRAFPDLDVLRQLLVHRRGGPDEETAWAQDAVQLQEESATCTGTRQSRHRQQGISDKEDAQWNGDGGAARDTGPAVRRATSYGNRPAGRRPIRHDNQQASERFHLLSCCMHALPMVSNPILIWISIALRALHACGDPTCPSFSSTSSVCACALRCIYDDSCHIPELDRRTKLS